MNPKTLVPESVHTIYSAYINRVPLKLVMLDHTSAIELSEGIRESLTSPDRDVKIEIKIKNKKPIGEGTNFGLGFLPKAESHGIVGSMQNAELTGDVRIVAFVSVHLPCFFFYFIDSNKATHIHRGKGLFSQIIQSIVLYVIPSLCRFDYIPLTLKERLSRVVVLSPLLNEASVSANHILFFSYR
jgi:hypothetical protein